MPTYLQAIKPVTNTKTHGSGEGGIRMGGYPNLLRLHGLRP